MLRICIYCQSPFRPHVKVPSQKVCFNHDCQKARRKEWQRRKIKNDDDYKRNQSNAQKAWTKRNPEYWQNYRSAHPEYVERNRRQQKIRNIRSRYSLILSENDPKMIAKMNDLKGKSSIKSGYYMLYPISTGEIAKMDEILVKIDVISKS
jgi:hypothetical protein